MENLSTLFSSPTPPTTSPRNTIKLTEWESRRDGDNKDITGRRSSRALLSFRGEWKSLMLFLHNNNLRFNSRDNEQVEKKTSLFWAYKNENTKIKPKPKAQHVFVKKESQTVLIKLCKKRQWKFVNDRQLDKSEKLLPQQYQQHKHSPAERMSRFKFIKSPF